MARLTSLLPFLLVYFSKVFSKEYVRLKTVRWDLHRYKRSELAFCAIREDPQCCLGSPCCGVNLHGTSCCCDEACILYNDCCPDYISTCQAGPCNQYTIIQNEEKRSSGYVMNNTTDVPISDEMTNKTWYRVISENGEEMPKYPPGVLHCGTVNPIWLNDSLPTTEEGNLTRTACMQTSQNDCEEEITISIVNCPAGFYVYNLKNTSKDSAYCFGSGPVLCPDGLSSETGYYPGCFSSFPNETVSPKVEPLLINGPTFNIPNYSPTPSLLPVFKCRFNDIANGTYVYDVYWYINGYNVTMYKNIEFHHINTTFLKTSDWINEYQMNMNPAKTEYTVIEGENITIPMTSTVPVSCIASHPDIRTKCAQNFFIFQPKYGKNEASCLNSIAKRDIVFEAEFCGIKLGNLDWNETKYLQVYGSSDGIYNHQGRSTFIRISTKSVSPFNELWRDIKIPEIKVTILDKDSVLTTRLCQSYNDPHITTFDGKLYHYMEVGEFVLYRNDRGPYWVHTLLTNCGYGWSGSSCHCGIAIRSRGSLFVLRTCAKISRNNKYLLQQPYTELLTCDDNDMSIEHIGNTYKITLQIGTEIKFTVASYSKFISGISIKPSIYDIDAARGLCGVPSVTKDNSDDFTHRDLGPISDEKSFADSWRINSSSSPNEQLFIKEPAFLYDDVVIYTEENTKVNITVSKYCVCDKEAGPANNLEQFYTVRCNLTESTQYCSSETNENDNSIQPFVTSCYYNTRKKRSLSHQINRRSATYNDDVIDDSPLEYDDDIQNTTFTNPEFRNGWTEVEANKTCTERIQNSVPTELLTDLCGLTSDDYIKSCILDIKLTADTSFIKDTVGAMQTYALMEVSRNESLAIQGTGDGNKTILEYITSLICPNNCSDNGNCTSGICSCYEGYVEDDCSKQTSTPPSNILLPTNGLCGTRSRGCTRTNIFGAFPSTNVWCKRRHFQILNNTHEYTSDAEIVKAEYRNAFMISVDLQSSRRKRSVSTEVVAEGYELSLSNDGNQFGDSVNMIIYDDECYSCNASSIICIVLDTCPELTSPNTESSSEHTTPSRGTSPKLTTSIAEITSNTAMTSSEMSNSGEATPSVLTTSTPELSSREGAAELTLTTMVKHVTTTLKPLTEVYTILTSKEISKDETTSPFEPTHKKDETTTVFKPTIKEIESTSKQSTTIYSNEGQETTISTEISTKSKTTKSTEKQTGKSSATSFKLITTDIKRANTIHDTSEPITTDSFISTEESTTPSTTSTNIKLTSTETAINQKLTTDHSEKTTNEKKTTNFNLMSTDKTTKQMATTTNDPTTLQSTTEHRKKNDIVSLTTKDTSVTNTETMNTLSITEQETTIVIDGQTTSKQSTEGEKSFIFTEPTTTLSTTKQESTITTTDQSTTLSSTEQHTAISNNEQTTTLSKTEQDKTITTDQPTTKLSVTEQETTTYTSQPTTKLFVTEQPTVVAKTESTTTGSTTEQDITSTTPQPTSTLRTKLETTAIFNQKTDQHTAIKSTEKKTTLSTKEQETTINIDQPTTQIITTEQETIINTNQPTIKLSTTEQETTIHTDQRTTKLSTTEQETTINTDQPTIKLSTTEQETTIHTDQPTTKLSTTEQETTINTDQPTTKLSTTEQATTINTDQLTTKLSKTIQETTIHTDQPTTKLSTTKQETIIYSDQPTTKLSTIEQETTINTDQPTTQIITTEQETTINTDQPTTQLSTTEQKTTIYTDQPTIKLSTTEQEITIHTDQPTTKLSTTEQETTINTDQPTTKFRTTEQETTINSDQPTTKLSTTEQATTINTDQLTTKLSKTIQETIIYSDQPTTKLSTIEQETTIKTDQPTTKLSTTEQETISNTDQRTTKLTITEQETTINTDQPTTKLSKTDQETIINSDQPTTKLITTDQETTINIDQLTTKLSTTDRAITINTDQPTTKLITTEQETAINTTPPTTTLSTVEQDTITTTTRPTTTLSVTTKNATSEVTTNINIKSSDSPAPAKPSVSDRDEAVAYVGPIVMGCSVFIFILIAIIVFIYWKIKKTNLQKRNIDEMGSDDSSYQVKRWSIYNGQFGSFLKKTPENSLNFRCAARHNTSERDDIFSQLKQDSWTTA